MSENKVQHAHSAIGASSMERWAACPGSVRLCVGIPRTSSKYADEGTLAHDGAATKLESGKYPPDFDSEMQEATDIYVDLIEKELFVAGQKLERLIEHKFDLSKIYPGLFGTCDAIIFDEYAKVLRVYDYKHGAGIPVEVVEDGKPNVQLSYYALGALISTGFECDTVELIIVQPRCNHPNGPIRRHSFPSYEILDFAIDLQAYAKETENPNALLVPGDHCRFCPANAVCPTVKAKAQALAIREFSAVEPINKNDGTVLAHGGIGNVTSLSESLSWLPILESWIKNTRDFAYSLAAQGKEIPGWKLVEKRASRKWKNETEVQSWITSNLSDSVIRGCFDPPTLKSPPSLEKYLHKKQFEKMDHLIVKESSGTTLVEESDKRPAVKILDAKTEFEVLDLFS